MIRFVSDLPRHELININVRLRGILPLLDKLAVYALVTPGYSIFLIPSSAKAYIENPKGFEIGFYAGGSYDIIPNLGVFFELGYQLGFQKLSVMGISASAGVDYLALNLGAHYNF
jgi:hypothetical protein